MGFYEAATVVGLALGAAVGGKLHDQFGSLSFTIVAFLYVLALVPFLFVRDRAWVPHSRISQVIPQIAEADPRSRVVRIGASLGLTAMFGHFGALIGRMLNRRIMRFAPAWLAANAVLGAWFSVGPFLAAGAPNQHQFLMRGFSPGEIGMAYLIFG